MHCSTYCKCICSTGGKGLSMHTTPPPSTFFSKKTTLIEHNMFYGNGHLHRKNKWMSLIGEILHTCKCTVYVHVCFAMILCVQDTIEVHIIMYTMKCIPFFIDAPPPHPPTSLKCSATTECTRMQYCI